MMRFAALYPSYVLRAVDGHDGIGCVIVWPTWLSLISGFFS